MIVYKFGGASVRSAEGVKNLRDIVSQAACNGLLVIVSAMGKTTNALEGVVSAFMEGRREDALAALDSSRQYHMSICDGLFGHTPSYIPDRARALFDELSIILKANDPEDSRYDYWYDRIVSYGELISTTIIAEYLDGSGVPSRWLDIRKCFLTTSRHRDANIDIEASGRLLRRAVGEDKSRIVVTQGFIGASADGQTTTLGREGSDYSAAVAANILDAESLTIWKDVDGILNADPKFFHGTQLIPQLNYLDAIELAYSGAQVIHPKTIKPLQNKDISLYVRPFSHPSASGSRISADTEVKIGQPVLILKKKQVLVSVRPNDFSFVVEEKLPEIFELMRSHNIRMNLIQSSAVNLSLCVDECRQLDRFGKALRGHGFRVVHNEGLELLTIRGYDEETFVKHTSGDGIFLVQKTRRIVRIVRTGTPDGVCLNV